MTRSVDILSTSAIEDGTVKALLDAAERLFAEQGYARTPVREITAAAGCNLAAINYHFGSKEELYRQVFSRCLRELRERRLTSIDSIDGSHSPAPAAALEALIERFAIAYVEPLLADDRGRLIMELMLREFVSPQLPRDIFVQGILEPVESKLAETLMATMNDLDALMAGMCVQSITAQLSHAVHLQMMMKDLDTEHPPMMPSMKQILEHVVRFSVGGVLATCGQQSLDMKPTAAKVAVQRKRK